jgi:hypothetical protein
MSILSQRLRPLLGAHGVSPCRPGAAKPYAHGLPASRVGGRVAGQVAGRVAAPAAAVASATAPARSKLTASTHTAAAGGMAMAFLRVAT